LLPESRPTFSRSAREPARQPAGDRTRDIGHLRSASSELVKRRPVNVGLADRPVTGAGDYGESMPAGNRSRDGQWQELYAQVKAARRQSRVLTARHRAARCKSAAILQRIHAARDRAEQLGELWLAAHPGADRLRYSAYTRLQAQLQSMPVIEQAKGIIMAHTGWPEDQAFDALRRASQRYNIKVRDLATQTVAQTARPASAQPSCFSPPQRDRARRVSIRKVVRGDSRSFTEQQQRP